MVYPRALSLLHRPCSERSEPKRQDRNLSTEEKSFRTQVELCIQNANNIKDDMLRCAFTARGPPEGAHIIPHSEQYINRTTVWLKSLGAIPWTCAAEAKLGYENILQLHGDLHKFMDAQPAKAVLLPTMSTLKDLCIAAEDKMCQQEAMIRLQQEGSLWRMDPAELLASWPHFISVDGHKVPIYDYELLLFVQEWEFDAAGLTILDWPVTTNDRSRARLVDLKDPGPPAQLAPPLPQRCLAISPAFALPMVLAAFASMRTSQALPAHLTEKVDLCRYWLKIASGEQVSQWRQFNRPSSLMSRVQELAPPVPSSHGRRWYCHPSTEDEDEGPSPSTPPQFSSSPPKGYGYLDADELYCHKRSSSSSSLGPPSSPSPKHPTQSETVLRSLSTSQQDKKRSRTRSSGGDRDQADGDSSDRNQKVRCHSQGRDSPPSLCRSATPAAVDEEYTAVTRDALELLAFDKSKLLPLLENGFIALGEDFYSRTTLFEARMREAADEECD
ncbi:unnamed protein product [Sympodiomycopsis kandeliae]